MEIDRWFPLFALLFIAGPILITTVFVNVDTWLWRGILLGSVALTSFWSFAIALGLSVVLIIGVAFASSLSGITGSPV